MFLAHVNVILNLQKRCTSLSSCSMFPSYICGVHHFGWDFAYVTISNPTIWGSHIPSSWMEHAGCLTRKNPLYRRLRGESNLHHCILQDSDPNTLATKLFWPHLSVSKRWLTLLVLPQCFFTLVQWVVCFTSAPQTTLVVIEHQYRSFFCFFFFFFFIP